MKVSSSRKDSFRPDGPNGPECCTVAQTAKPVRITLTMAVSRGPRRSAANTSGRMARKPSGAEYSERGTSGLKAIKPTAMADASTASIGPNSSRSSARKPLCAHSTIAGVTTRAPAVSPSHQVTQISAKSSQRARPATVSVTTPTEALITVAGPTQTSANFATRAGVVKVCAPPDHCMIRKPPASASIVLPSAIKADVANVPAVVALAANAPTRIAGHIRRPPNSTAASAMPVGGQIGLALGLTEANCKPSLART